MRTQYFIDQPDSVVCFFGNSGYGTRIYSDVTVKEEGRITNRGIVGFWHRSEMTADFIRQVTQKEAEKFIGRKSFREFVRSQKNP